jgi:hypothetical protein
VGAGCAIDVVDPGKDDEDVREESMAPGKVRWLDKVLDSSFVDGDGNIGVSNKGTEKV